MKAPLTIFFLAAALVALAQSLNAYIKKGNQYYKQGDFQRAEMEYRQALETDPNSNEARFNLANALHQQKKYDEADRVLQQLVVSGKDSTTRSFAAYNQGVGHTKQKKLEQSIEAYKQALRMKPDDQQARENLQKALKELRQQQQSQSNQQNQSSMDQSEADQKLRLLQQKERQIRQRAQRSQGGGGSQSKDW